MTKKQRFEAILEYFSVAVPEPETELMYDNPFQLLVCAKDSLIPEETLPLSLQEFSTSGNLAGLFGKMSLVSSTLAEDKISQVFNMRLKNSGIRSRGVCLTLKTSVAPLDAQECLLSDILEKTGDLPPEYFLSPTAANSILKQEIRINKSLPHHLREGYRMAANPSL